MYEELQKDLQKTLEQVTHSPKLQARLGIKFEAIVYNHTLTARQKMRLLQIRNSQKKTIFDYPFSQEVNVSDHFLVLFYALLPEVKNPQSADELVNFMGECHDFFAEDINFYGRIVFYKKLFLKLIKEGASKEKIVTLFNPPFPLDVYLLAEVELNSLQESYTSALPVDAPPEPSMTILHNIREDLIHYKKDPHEVFQKLKDRLSSNDMAIILNSAEVTLQHAYFFLLLKIMFRLGVSEKEIFPFLRENNILSGYRPTNKHEFNLHYPVIFLALLDFHLIGNEPIMPTDLLYQWFFFNISMIAFIRHAEYFLVNALLYFNRLIPKTDDHVFLTEPVSPSLSFVWTEIVKPNSKLNCSIDSETIDAMLCLPDFFGLEDKFLDLAYRNLPAIKKLYLHYLQKIWQMTQSGSIRRAPALPEINIICDYKFDSSTFNLIFQILNAIVSKENYKNVADIMNRLGLIGSSLAFDVGLLFNLCVALYILNPEKKERICQDAAFYFKFERKNTKESLQFLSILPRLLTSETQLETFEELLKQPKSVEFFSNSAKAKFALFLGKGEALAAQWMDECGKKRDESKAEATLTVLLSAQSPIGIETIIALLMNFKMLPPENNFFNTVASNKNNLNIYFKLLYSFLTEHVSFDIIYNLLPTVFSPIELTIELLEIFNALTENGYTLEQLEEALSPQAKLRENFQLNELAKDYFFFHPKRSTSVTVAMQESTAIQKVDQSLPRLSTSLHDEL